MNDYEQGKKLGVLAYMEKLSDKDKAVVAFGMIPAWAAEEYGIVGKDMNRGFAIGMMEAAKAPGGRGMVV